MVKSKYALESDLEKGYSEVNEKEWQKRRILDRCVNTYIKDTERREKADNELNKLFADEDFRELVKNYLKNKEAKK